MDSKSSMIMMMLLLTITTLLVFPLTSPLPLPSSQPPSLPAGFRAEIIPKTDPRSPYYNYNNPATHDILVLSDNPDTDDPAVRTILKPNNVVVFEVGYPPYQMFAIPDTGSSLSWVQCQPCSHCYEQPVPLFDPKNTSFYCRVMCMEDECRLESVSTYCVEIRVFSNCGDYSNRCGFSINYYDGSYARGEVLQAWISFPGSKADIGYVVYIGCGYDNKMSARTDITGILGLDTSNASLLSQLNYTKFSYCHDLDRSSWISFGASAYLGGNTHIPLLLPNPFHKYHIHLVGIKVNNVQLDIKDYFEFKETSSYETGMIIDSGTTMTHLPSDVISQMAKQVETRIAIRPLYYNGQKVYCFENSFWTYLRFPKIVLQFEGGATLYVPFTNAVFQNPPYFCLAFWASKDDHFHILGYYTLQSMTVGYDLENKEIVIGSGGDDCP